MKQGSENNIQDLLQKWLSGKARAKEERQLEELAKEDPFLSDALEGMRDHPEEDHAAAVARIKDKLYQRVEHKERRGIIFLLPRIAAAIALVVIGLGGFWLINRSDMGESAVAQTEQATEAAEDAEQPTELRPASGQNQETETKEALAEEPPEPEFFEGADQPVGNNDLPEKENKIADLTEPAPSSPSPVIEEDEEVASAEPQDEQFGSEIDDQLATVLTEKPQPAETEPAPPPARAKKEKQEAADSYALEELSKDKKDAFSRTLPQENRSLNGVPITGQVTDTRGKPLAGANVILEGTNSRALTDFEGRFLLNASGSGPSRQNLIVTSAGFEPQTIPANLNDSVQVTLPDAQLLEEIEISSYQSKKPNQANKTSNRNLAVGPEGGFGKFKEYLEKNRKYPEEALKAGISGNVILQFKVNKNGSLTNFEVVRSLGYGLDEEAERLLKRGPRWDNQTGEQIITTYSIPFEK